MPNEAKDVIWKLPPKMFEQIRDFNKTEFVDRIHDTLRMGSIHGNQALELSLGDHRI
jgi:hypothetical protein